MIDYTVKGCQACFVSLLEGPNNKYAWFDEPTEEEMPGWIIERKADVAKDLNLNTIREFATP